MCSAAAKQMNITFTPVFTPVVAPVFTRVHPCVHPCVPVHPWDTSRYKSAQPQRSGEEWVRKGAHNTRTCHAVQSCAECFEQGWRIWVDLHGVLWSVLARRWCTGTQGVSYPSPVGAFAFPLTSAPGRLRLRKCLRQGTNLRA